MKGARTSGWSLRVLVPLLILIAGLTIVAVQYALAYRVESTRVRQEMTRYLHVIGSRLVRSASESLARDRRELLGADARSMVELLPDLEFVAIADGTGTVIASSDPTWRGKALAQHPTWTALTAADAPIGEHTERVDEIAEGERLGGLFAYGPPPGRATLDGGERAGWVLASLDLRAPLHAVHHQVLLIAGTGGAVVGLIVALFWLVLDRVLTRPVGRLVETVRAFESGDFVGVDGAGRSRELGEIASALTRLGRTLRDAGRTQAARNRLAQIVEDSTSEIYVADANSHRLLDANRAARDNLGYAPEEIVGLGPWDFVEGLDRDAIEALVAPLREGVLPAQSFETVHRRRDGSTYPVEARVRFMATQTPPVYVAIVRDITERATRDERIRLLERAVEEIDVGVAITDATHDGYPLVYVNEALCRMNGYGAGELLGRRVVRLHREDAAPADYAAIDAARARGEPVQALLETTRKDGSRYMNELSLSPVHDAAGRVTHYIGISRDVTSRLESEARQRETQRLESVGLLAGGVAHDFNNNLSIVLGHLELLALRTDDAALLKHVDGASSAANAAALLTRRLLAFARQGRLEPVVVDISERVIAAIELLRPSIGEQIELSSTLSTELWETRVDVGEIENAVVNLVLNARDAMPDGGRIEIATANVHLDEEEVEGVAAPITGEHVMLSVADSGTGMSEEVRQRAFEPFFTTKAIGEGSGLGLASVYGFARQSGGAVRIRSKRERGTLVSIYLPRHDGSRSAVAATVSGDVRPTAPGGRESVAEAGDSV